MPDGLYWWFLNGTAMASTVWSEMRKRQYPHVKANVMDPGVVRRFGKTGAANTVIQLRNEATQRALPGRSRMKKV